MASLLLPFHPSRITFISKSFILPSHAHHADSAAPFPFSSAPHLHLVSPAQPMGSLLSPTLYVGPSQPSRGLGEITQADSRVIRPPIPPAVRPSVPPGFMPPQHNTKSAVRPSVSPGFMPLQSNTDPVVQSNGYIRQDTSSASYQLLIGSSNGNAAQPIGPIGGGSAQNYQYQPNVKAVMNQIQVIAKGYQELQREITILKKQNGSQAGSINWLKEDVRSYEESKIVISNLQGDVVQLVNHAQAVENSYVNMMFQVENVVSENEKLGGLVGELKEELGQVRKVIKQLCMAGSIVGVIGFVAGVIKWIK